MVRRVTIAWSKAALRDLDRFAIFLQGSNPRLAERIADAIIAKVDSLAAAPLMGRSVGNAYRQVVLLVERASYVIQYRYADRQLTILRVFHGRENFDRP